MSDTKRKIFIIVVLLLVLLFGVGQFFASSNLNAPSANPASQDASALSPTEVIPYVPSAPASGTPVLDGSCFANSIAAPYRADAWRCAVGNAINDPCFEIPGATGALVCGADPAGITVSSTFVLDLTKPLPPPDVPSGTPPTNWAWSVILSDGTTCTPFTGTRPFTASGDIAFYSCAGGRPGEDFIFGALNDASTTWTAEVGELSTSTKNSPPFIAASATVPVAAVWQ